MKGLIRAFLFALIVMASSGAGAAIVWDGSFEAFRYAVEANGGDVLLSAEHLPKNG